MKLYLDDDIMNEKQRIGDEIAYEICEIIAEKIMALACEDPKTYEEIYNHCWNRIRELAGGKNA